MPDLLAAYTLPGLAPGYLNISLDGDAVRVSVRAPGEPDGSCGEVSEVALPVREFLKLVSTAAQAIAKI